MGRRTLLFLTLLTVCFGTLSRAQNIISEGFEGATFPPAGWSDTITVDRCCGSLSDGWDQLCSFCNAPGNMPNPPAHTGNEMAYFDSWNIPSPGQAELYTPAMNFSPYTTGNITVSFWMYRDVESFYSSDNIAVYVNTSATSSGGTFLTRLYRDGGSYPSVSTTGWDQYTYTIPASYRGISNYIIFQANSDFGYDMFIDDVSVDHQVSPPTVTDYTYCQYAPTSPLAAVGISLKWYTTPSGGTGTSIPPIPNDSFPGTYTWYVTQTVGGLESSNRAVQTVTVFAQPPIPYTATAAYTYCQFENASILTAIGQNLLWYNSATGGSGNPIAPTPSTLTPGVFTYYVTQTVHGCESNRLPITVTVIAKPTPPTSTSPVYYCQNDVATPLTAFGADIHWYESATGGVASSVNPTPLTTYPNDTIYYYATQTINGCESDRTPVQVIIKPKPNAVILGSAPYVCQYDTMSFTYFGNGTNTAAYDWTIPNGGNVLTGSGQGPLVIRFDSFGHQIITLAVTTDGCTSPPATYNVDVRQAPTLQLTLQKDGCVNQVVPVQTSNPDEAITQYIWNFAGGNIVFGSTGPGPYGISWNNQGTYVVQLTAIADKCPSLSVNDTINIHPLGDAHIAHVSSTNACSGDSINFATESYNPAYFYQWTPANYFGTQNNSGDVYGNIRNTGMVMLQVTTDYGCVSIDSVLITTHPCCDLQFPNAFSPNGDGKNDIFRPLPGQGTHQIKRFTIVDRWGQTMFETNNESEGWDGKHNGVPQDIGTYYYYINYVCSDGKTYGKEGVVVLVK